MQFPQWDTDLFLFLNDLHCPLGDIIMWYVSKTLTLVIVFAIALFAIYKKFGWQQTLFALVGLALCVLFADRISSGLFKPFFARLRPTHALGDIVHTVRNYMGGKYGFVSSHAANAFAVSVFLIQILRQKLWTYSLIFIALTVAYSRIYLGVHYPLDILCGALLGAIIGYAVYLLYCQMHKSKILAKCRCKKV
ncbi:MAG: phosphatase PAP2 family protein [Bacteroidales bacterium]